MTRGKGRFFSDNLGEIASGRPNLGQYVPVSIYRMMQYTIRDVLSLEYGEDLARKIIYKAGKLAGEKFCREYLDTSLDFTSFVTELKNLLIEMKIGILRIEELDLENMNLVLTIAEDLDCSGLPVTEETVCVYDEGFIAGILKAYTGQDFIVKEVDCWASGDTVCRFHISQ
ncbi:MAG: V4R domain-containing protein [Zhaonellaceae bacterium]|nr:4-vinyl reductase [Clostridia bacterium]